MIEEEFEAIWASQTTKSPSLFSDSSRALIKDCLLFQRPLRPVKPGRCTFFPEEERAPIALPSVQQFRILQELNNLRILGTQLTETLLDLDQRDKAFHLLNTQKETTFGKIRSTIGAPKTSSFNLEDAKRTKLKGNHTSAILSADECFGARWHSLSLREQDEVFEKLLKEENEGLLISWLAP
jgi:CRISPR-associated endonuclease Csn1